MLLCPPVLTEALRVELPAHGADAGLPRLPLLQPQVQLLLELHDVQAGAGHAGHLLHPQLLVLLPLPAPKSSGKAGYGWGPQGGPPGPSRRLPPRSHRGGRMAFSSSWGCLPSAAAAEAAGRGRGCGTGPGCGGVCGVPFSGRACAGGHRALWGRAGPRAAPSGLSRAPGPRSPPGSASRCGG